MLNEIIIDFLNTYSVHFVHVHKHTYYDLNFGDDVDTWYFFNCYVYHQNLINEDKDDYHDDQNLMSYQDHHFSLLKIHPSHQNQ